MEKETRNFKPWRLSFLSRFWALFRVRNELFSCSPCGERVKRFEN